jgi:membrane-associated phospholipid phosphatase
LHKLKSLLFWEAPTVLCLGIAAVIFACELNIPLFQSIQRAGESGSAAFWQSVTLFGNGLVALVLCGVWLRRRPEAIWSALLAAIPAALITRIFKMAIDLPRPSAVLFDQVHVLGPAFRHASFPSGHAVTAFLLAGIACSV